MHHYSTVWCNTHKMVATCASITQMVSCVHARYTTSWFYLIMSDGIMIMWNLTRFWILSCYSMRPMCPTHSNITLLLSCTKYVQNLSCITFCKLIYTALNEFISRVRFFIRDMCLAQEVQKYFFSIWECKISLAVEQQRITLKTW